MGGIQLEKQLIHFIIVKYKTDKMPISQCPL